MRVHLSAGPDFITFKSTQTAVLLLLNIEGENTVQAGLLDFKTDETTQNPLDCQTALLWR